MSAAPTAHSSHANTYSHGASSIPKSPSRVKSVNSGGTTPSSNTSNHNSARIGAAATASDADRESRRTSLRSEKSNDGSESSDTMLSLPSNRKRMSGGGGGPITDFSAANEKHQQQRRGVPASGVASSTLTDDRSIMKVGPPVVSIGATPINENLTMSERVRRIEAKGNSQNENMIHSTGNEKLNVSTYSNKSSSRERDSHVGAREPSSRSHGGSASSQQEREQPRVSSGSSGTTLQRDSSSKSLVTPVIVSSSTSTKPRSSSSSTKSSSTKSGSSSKKKSSSSAVSTTSSATAKNFAEQYALTNIAEHAAELLQEKRELEERIAAREEEKKVTEQVRTQKIEIDRLSSESKYDVIYNKQHESRLLQLETEIQQQVEWEKYLECNPLPDVQNESSLNSYISKYREIEFGMMQDEEGDESSSTSTSSSLDSSHLIIPHHSLTPLLQSCHLTERVCSSLSSRMIQVREEWNMQAYQKYERYIHLLRKLTAIKLNALTCKYLHRSDEYESANDSSYTTASATPSISYGLWIHNSNKERIKRIDWKEQLGIEIELPQSLQKTRTAVRCVRTEYDMVSGVRIVPVVNTTNSGNGEKKSISEEKQNDTSNNPTSSASSLRPTSTTTVRNTNSSNPNNNHIFTELPGFDDSLLDPTKIFEFTSGGSEDASNSGSINTRIPDTRTHFVSVGGIIELHQLLLPAPAKKLKSWIMRDSTPLEKQCVIVPYPSEENVNSGVASGNGGIGGVSGTSNASASIHASTAHAHNTAPLRIKLTLPPYIFLNDREPMFGVWDATAGKKDAQERGAWSQENVQILEFNSTTRQVTLSVPTIKPLAVIQPRALDFPYRSWMMESCIGDTEMEESQLAEPSSKENQEPTIRLSVTGSRFTVGFDLHGLLSRLSSPRHAFLSNFTSEWSTPGRLISDLDRVGVRVAPTDEDAEYARKPRKEKLLIRTLHTHLALLPSVYSISSSPHNVGLSSTSAAFRICLSSRSHVLSSARARKERIDFELAMEEEEAREEEEEKKRQAAAPLTKEELEEKKKQEEIRAQIRAMEGGGEEEDGKDGSGGDSSSISALAAALSSSHSTILSSASSSSDISRATTAGAKGGKKGGKGSVVGFEKNVTESLTKEQKYALGFEWVTVLAELLDASSPLAPSSATPARATSAQSLSERILGGGTQETGLPEGVLMRFTLIRGTAPDGSCDTTPIQGEVSHFSLRRCLLAYFTEKTPHDLTTAMGMRLMPSEPSETDNLTPAAVYHFLPTSAFALQTQQTIRRTLNLLRPFEFC